MPMRFMTLKNYTHRNQLILRMEFFGFEITALQYFHNMIMGSDAD